MRWMLLSSLAILATSCVMGGPEDAADPKAALEGRTAALGLVAEEALPEPSTEGALVTTMAPASREPGEWDEPMDAALACDTMCTVRGFVAGERYEEAREALAAELEARPDDVSATLALAAVEIADEEYGAAYELADDHLHRAGGDVRLMEKRATASLLQHDVETAAEDFGELVAELQALNERDPAVELCDVLTSCCLTPAAMEAHAWASLATAEYNRGDLDSAERIARDVLRGDHRSRIDPAYASFVLGLVASKRDDDEAAMRHYQEVLARFPNEPATLNNVGCLHYSAGDLDKAWDFHMASFENAGPHRRTAALAFANLAEIDMLKGRYAEAEDKLLETLQISKRFAAGHMNLAVLYDILGRHRESRDQMARGLALDEQGVTRWNMSWLTRDWEVHFKALVAEQEGRRAEAQALWKALAGSETAVLDRTARHHLGWR